MTTTRKPKVTTGGEDRTDPKLDHDAAEGAPALPIEDDAEKVPAELPAPATAAIVEGMSAAESAVASYERNNTAQAE